MAQKETDAQNYEYFQVCYVCFTCDIFQCFLSQIDDADSDFEADDDASKVLLVSPIHSIHSSR